MHDTIIAPATPVGSAITIVRISGPGARRVLTKLFRPKGKGAAFDSHRLVYGHVVDTQGRAIDEGMAVYFQAPRSYTREHAAEIHLHGSPAVLAQTLEAAAALGARMAEPGEFTQRAFLNGRLDLSQAEAVMDLIRARTNAQSRSALEQLSGGLRVAMADAQDALIGLLAALEASIDYPEEIDAPKTSADAAAGARELAARLENACDARAGRMLREGLRIVMAGPPNAGKSSLLNALVGQDRAIVTPIAGTTRDTIEETMLINGMLLHLTDTAGLRETDDTIERQGVMRTRDALTKADAILLVVDSSAPLDASVLSVLKDATCPFRIALNKQDLAAVTDVAAIQKALASQNIAANEPCVLVLSALDGTGLESLRAWLSAIAGEAPAPGMLTKARHIQAATHAAKSLRQAADALDAGLDQDCATIDLRAALHHLGQITGDTVDEDVIGRIFSDFCVGK